MEGKQIKFGIEISPELHRKLKVAVAERGTSMKKATAEALAVWLGAESPEKSILTPLREGDIIFPEAQEIVEILARISDDERRDLIEDIRLLGQRSIDVTPKDRARNLKAAAVRTPKKAQIGGAKAAR